jgi:hypothetical protein
MHCSKLEMSHTLGSLLHLTFNSLFTVIPTLNFSIAFASRSHAPYNFLHFRKWPFYHHAGAAHHYQVSLLASIFCPDARKDWFICFSSQDLERESLLTRYGGVGPKEESKKTITNEYTPSSKCMFSFVCLCAMRPHVSHCVASASINRLWPLFICLLNTHMLNSSGGERHCAFCAAVYYLSIYHRRRHLITGLGSVGRRRLCSNAGWDCVQTCNVISVAQTVC